MAILGLLKVVAGPCKVPALCLFQKLNRKTHMLTSFKKKRRVEALKCNFNKKISDFCTDRDLYFLNSNQIYRFLG